MEKIKEFLESDKGKDIMIVTIVILVGLGSFELGRLSKEGNGSGGVKIEYTEDISNQQAGNVISVMESSSLLPARNASHNDAGGQNIEIANSVGKNFFASNRGTKYYSIGCSAGKTIKQENRVYFATSEDAQRAGYELSSSCR